ncbi:MAG: hypothetical protein ACT4PX_08760 [Actinomycetota bacterium]
MPTAEDRTAAIEALGMHIGAEAAAILDQLLPSRPWREYVPGELLMRSGVVTASDRAALSSLYRALAERIGSRHAGVLLEFLLPARPSVLQARGVLLSR